MNFKVVSIENKKVFTAYDFFLVTMGTLVLSAAVSAMSTPFKTFEEDKNNLLTYSDMQKINKENVYGFSKSQLEVLGSLSLNLESGRLDRGFWLGEYIVINDVTSIKDTMIRRNLSDVRNFDRPLYDKLSAQLNKFNDSLLWRSFINMMIFAASLPFSAWLWVVMIEGSKRAHFNNESNPGSDQGPQG